MNTDQLVKVMLDEWRSCETIKNMKTANKYYEVENEQIEQKTRAYKDAAGNLVQNESLSNIKIPSGFLRMSVDQKVDYAFGKPFIINTRLKDENISDEIKTDYQKAWEEFNTPKNREQIKELAKNAVNCGIGWCYPEIKEDTFGIISVEPDNVYPQWTDRTHTDLLAVVRDYIEKEYRESGVCYVNIVEYWDTDSVTKYTCDADTYELTPNGEPVNHLVYSTPIREGEEQGTGWGKVPFIPLKSSRDETPLLKLIKKYVDAYDELNSKSVDSLVDDIDPIIVFEGISGDVKDLTEARIALKNLRIASVEAGGKAYYLQVNPNITSTQEKLEHLEKDIKNFSSTINTQDIELGSNPSGIALKAAYQDLDIYVNKLEVQFEVFIENLKYFFDKWLVQTGKFTQQQVDGIEVIVTLDRDMMINETELIENTSKLSGLVSQETLDSYNPAVESHEIEQERREQEQEDKTNKEMNDLFNFGNANNNPNNQNQEEQDQNENQENEQDDREQNQDNVSQ